MSESARPATAAILTLGCKLNIADSEAMARRLRDAGWRVVDRPADAEAVIVNTCSVTHVADQKSRHLVRLARRGALKTRAFISAQEGCNDVCAFCIIPRTRGRERSKSVEDVVAEAQAREAEGVQEIVITGTQLGAYGRDRSASLCDLMSVLVSDTSIPRIRMSSVQPQDLTEELIDLWQSARLCRHFHLALQSGSEGVLRRMRRRYSAEEYRGAVERLRAAIPDVAI